MDSSLQQYSPRRHGRQPGTPRVQDRERLALAGYEGSSFTGRTDLRLPVLAKRPDGRVMTWVSGTGSFAVRTPTFGGIFAKKSTVSFVLGTVRSRGFGSSDIHTGEISGKRPLCSGRGTSPPMKVKKLRNSSERLDSSIRGLRKPTEKKSVAPRERSRRRRGLSAPRGSLPSAGPTHPAGQTSS